MIFCCHYDRSKEKKQERGDWKDIYNSGQRYMYVQCYLVPDYMSFQLIV